MMSEEYLTCSSLDERAALWLQKHSSYLIHEDQAYGPTKSSYASPYYDYEKAHEYYEKHKQLKGRTRSKSQLNDEGKEILEVSQYNIQKKRDAERQNAENQTKIQIESIQNQISNLRTLSANDRQIYKDEIQKRIDSLREQLSSKKESLRNELEIRRSKAKNDTKTASELTKRANQSIVEKGKKEKESNTSKSQNKIDKLQKQLKSLGNTEQDKKNKEKIREEIAKIRVEKAVKNSEVTQKVNLGRSQNQTRLSDFREKTSEEVSRYRAETTSELKNVNNNIQNSIKTMQEDIKNFNTYSREVTNKKTKELRNNIKTLREANAANRKMIIEKYKNESDAEFDRIYEKYQKKQKTKRKSN